MVLTLDWATVDALVFVSLYCKCGKVELAIYHLHSYFEEKGS